MTEQAHSTYYPDQGALVLHSSMQYGEPMASEAINRNFHNVLTHGVYEGFDCTLAGGLAITIAGTGKQHTLVARHEKISLTIHAQHPASIVVPVGRSTLVVDSFYQYGVQTKQTKSSSSINAAEYKIIAIDAVLPHHVILAEFDVPAGATALTDLMIDYSTRSTGGIGIAEHLNQYDPHSQYARLESLISTSALATRGNAMAIENAGKAQQAKAERDNHLSDSNPHDQYELGANQASDLDVKEKSNVKKHVKLPQLWKAIQQEIASHLNKTQPHTQYERVDNEATDKDIGDVSTAKKHVKLPQLWKAITNKIKAHQGEEDPHSQYSRLESLISTAALATRGNSEAVLSMGKILGIEEQQRTAEKKVVTLMTGEVFAGVVELPSGHVASDFDVFIISGADLDGVFSSTHDVQSMFEFPAKTFYAGATQYPCGIKGITEKTFTVVSTHSRAPLLKVVGIKY